MSEAVVTWIDWRHTTSSTCSNRDEKTKSSPPDHHDRLAFESMADGMYDLNSGNNVGDSEIIYRGESSSSSSYPICREAALQVDRMKRKMTETLQEVSVQQQRQSTLTSSSANHDDFSPFWVSSEEGSMADLMSSYETIQEDNKKSPEMTVEPVSIPKKVLTTSVGSCSSGSRPSIVEGHMPYMSISEDGPFDLKTDDSCTDDAYVAAMKDLTTRMAGLEHDRMERKEQQTIFEHETAAKYHTSSKDL